MEFLTNDKLVIVGAGGMIGSNMVQSALMLGLTPNICLYVRKLVGLGKDAVGDDIDGQRPFLVCVHYRLRQRH